MNHRTDFLYFGPLHFVILLGTPVVALLLARAMRHSAHKAKVATMLGALFLLGEGIWYSWLHLGHGDQFPYGLPLQLCGYSALAAGIAGVRKSPLAFEFAYFAGIAGAYLAMITPDLWAPTLSYPTIYFFVSHAMIVILPLFLAWTGQLRPRPGCLWRVMALWNGLALFTGLFDWLFQANYMYLCAKPAASSPLDAMGPWPVYIFVGQLLGLAVFSLLYLPWKLRGATPAGPSVL